jgi:hypothetical protein
LKGVNPLEAAVLVAVLVLPFHSLVLWQIGRLQDPAYLREHGIVVVRESALDGHTEAVGQYAGRPIWGTVIFMGMIYRFDRIARPREKERIGRRELYLDPGLIYLTD